MPQSLGGCKAKYVQSNRSELLALYYNDHQQVVDQMEVIKFTLSINDRWTEDKQLILDKFSSFMRHELEDHLLSEERFLFPVIAEALGDASGPILAMNTEHNKLRALKSELLNEIEACQLIKGKTPQFDELFQQVDEMLAEHIYKENLVLFPMAEQILSSDQKATILQQIITNRHQIN